MNSTAFVSATPFTARSHSYSFTSPSARSINSKLDNHVVAVPKRAARVLMMSEDEDKSIPQGFTLFSEQLNGRAAMMGFVLAVATEAITGQGIVGQLNSFAKVFELVTPFSGFN